MGDSSETVPLLPPKTPEISTRRRHGSLAIMFIFQFLCILQEGMFFTTLWPYLQEIDPSADESFFGYILAVYATVSTVVNPLFGAAANRLKQTRLPVLVAICFTITGSFGTCFAGNFTSNAKWALFISRAVTGVGGGAIGVLGAYLAMASTLEERNTVITLRSCIGAGGLLMGPAVSSIFSSIGYPGVSLGYLHINMYTAPAVAGIVVFASLFLVFVFVFKEHWIAVSDDEMTRKPGAESKLPRFDWLPIVVCLGFRFTFRFCETYDQAIGSPFTMTMFEWSRQEAIQYNGIIRAVTGLFEFVLGLAIGLYFLKFMRYRTAMIAGLSIFTLFFIISFSYPGLPLLAKEDGSNTTCLYTWCTYTTRIHLAQYIVGLCAMSIAFSFGYGSGSILFTKLFGPRKQGFYQGFFYSTSQLAAATAPLAVTSLFQKYGPRVAWALGLAILLAQLLLCIVASPRLVTYDEMLERRGLKQDNIDDTGRNQTNGLLDDGDVDRDHEHIVDGRSSVSKI